MADDPMEDDGWLVECVRCGMPVRYHSKSDAYGCLRGIAAEGWVRMAGVRAEVKHLDSLMNEWLDEIAASPRSKLVMDALNRLREGTSDA